MKYAHLLCQFLFTKKVKHWIAAILKQKMRQNVHQIVFQFPFFRTPATGGSAPDAQGGEAGERREMREGKGQGERKGGEGKGEEGTAPKQQARSRCWCVY